MLRLRFVVLVAVSAVAALPATASAAPVAHADRDHDKVFDDLEATLTRAGRRPVLISLREPASAARVRAIEGAVGDLGGVTRLRIVDALEAEATPREIRALARRADVAHVEEDASVVPFGVSAQAAFGLSRAREDLPGLDGRGMTAAVVDSGIDTTMPDLAGDKVIGFKDLINGRAAPYDDLDHGSLVSAILAGSGASGPEGRGAAPAANLVGVKVIDEHAQSSLGLIAQGIQWVVENRAKYGIDVLNLSIGDPTGCGDGTDVASQAVDAAVAAGIVVVVAAGNSGPASCTIKSPAAAESALTVGAMADTGAGGFSQAWFSSRGPTADGRMKPDISAPGVAVPIPAPGGALTLGSGTSAATPFVAGVALLELETNPALTPAEVKGTMERTAVDWGAPGRDNEYGYGRLDAYAALEAAGAALATPPAVPAHRAWGGVLAQGESASTDVEVADASFPLAVTLTGPGSGFDVSLLDATGAAVGTLTAQPVASRQEDLSLKAPAAGHYTVRVLARSGAGAFTVDVSGALAPADTAPPALALDAPGTPTNDATPELHGAAGTELGDFPGVVVQVRQGTTVVRRVGVTPLLGRWSAPVALPDGTYTVDAEQGDAAGNVTRTPARTLTVDTVAPPAPAVVLPAAGALVRSVALSGTAEPGSTVRVVEGATQRTAAVDDAGAWSVTLDGLADGAHTFLVTAADAAGNVSAATARSLTVDTTAPAATILSAPAGAINSPRPAVSFASEPGASFECRVDTGAFEACASPVTLGPLADGVHRFAVRATDAAGNVGAMAQSADFTVDTVAPAVVIHDPVLNAGQATLSFSSPETGVTFACRLDAAVVFEACTSPRDYGGLAAGDHVLRVRATDVAGNVGPEAARSWNVPAAPAATPTATPAAPPTPTPTPPAPKPLTLTVTLPKQRLATVLRTGLTVDLGCSSACRATLVLARGTRIETRRTLTGGRVSLKLSAASRKALARTRRVTLTVTVTAPGARSVVRRITLAR